MANITKYSDNVPVIQCPRCGILQEFVDLVYWTDRKYHCGYCYSHIDKPNYNCRTIIHNNKTLVSKKNSTHANHILFAIDGLYIAGVQRHVLDMCNQFRAWGWNITVVAIEAGGQWFRKFSNVANVVLACHPGTVEWADVVHAVDEPICVVSAHLKDPIDWATHQVPVNIPIVAHLHSEPSEHELIDEWWLEKTARRVKAFALPSESNRQTYLALLSKASLNLQNQFIKKSVIIPNIYHPSRSSVGQKIRGLSQHKIGEKLCVGVLSRLDRDKLDIAFLVDVLVNLARLPITVLIGGSGEEAERLENLIQKHHLQNTVKMIGNVFDIEVFLQKINLLLLPSKREGLPYVAVEAFEFGVPFVGACVGGLKQVPQSPACITYSPCDIEAAVTAVKDMLVRIREGIAVDTRSHREHRVRAVGADVETWMRNIQQVYIDS